MQPEPRKRGRKPMPRPEEHLDRVVYYTLLLTEAEERVAELRAARNTVMWDAKQAGATGGHLAEATGMNRRSVHDIFRGMGKSDG